MVKGFRKVLAITVALAMLLTTGMVGMVVSADTGVEVEAELGAWLFEAVTHYDFSRFGAIQWNRMEGNSWWFHNNGSWALGDTTGWLPMFLAENEGDMTFSSWDRADQVQWLSQFNVWGGFVGWAFYRWNADRDDAAAIAEFYDRWVNVTWPGLTYGMAAPAHLYTPAFNVLSPWAQGGELGEIDFWSMFFPDFFMNEEFLNTHNWTFQSHAIQAIGGNTGSGLVNFRNAMRNNISNYVGYFFLRSHWDPNSNNPDNWFDAWHADPDAANWEIFRNAIVQPMNRLYPGALDTLYAFGEYLLEHYGEWFPTGRNPLALSDNPADYEELMAAFFEVWNATVEALPDYDIINKFQTGWLAYLFPSEDCECDVVCPDCLECLECGDCERCEICEYCPCDCVVLCDCCNLEDCDCCLDCELAECGECVICGDCDCVVLCDCCNLEDCDCCLDCELAECGECVICGDCDCTIITPVTPGLVVDDYVITGLYFVPLVLTGNALVIVAIFENDELVNVIFSREGLTVAEVGENGAYRFVDLAGFETYLALDEVTAEQDVRAFVWGGFFNMMPMTATLLTWSL